MSILNVDKIQPIGGGSTITVDATDIQASTGTIKASTFSGDVSATGIGVTSLNVSGVSTFAGTVNAAAISASGNITIENAEPSIFFTDTNGNPDYKIFNDSGALKIYDTTYSATRLQIGPTNGEVTIASNTNFPNGITMNPGTASVVNTIAQRLGNTTAKIRFPANDTFTVETTGSERLRINSAGISTFYNSQLHIEGAGSGNVPLTINTDVASNNSVHPLIQAYSDNATYKTQIGLVREGSSGALGWAFFTNAVGSPTERLRIDSSGRLLLGTTTEGFAEADDLTINSADHGGITIRTPTNKEGNIAFSDTTSGTGEYSGLIRYRHSQNDLGLWTSSNLRLLIDSSGRVMIGTTAASTLTSTDDLTISTSGSTGITLFSGTGYAGNITFGDGTSGDDRQRGLLQYHHSDNSMRFFTNAVRRMTIDSNGQLLVGTTTSGANVRAVFQGYNGGGENFQARVQFQTAQATDLSTNHHLANLLFTNASSSIGAEIRVQADENWGTSDYPTRISFLTTANGSGTRYERMIIKNDGVVNIGVASPQYAKKVNIQGDNGYTLSLSNQDYTGNAANTFSGIEGRIQCGGGVWTSSGVRFVKDNGTSGDKHSRCELYATDGYSSKIGLIVNPDGEVSHPLQPSCTLYAPHAGQQINVAGDDVPIGYSQIEHNTRMTISNGGSSDSTRVNSRIQVPIAGRYLVSSLMSGSLNGSSAVDANDGIVWYLKKNGGTYSSPYNNMFGWDTLGEVTGEEFEMSFTVVISLAANDYLEVAYTNIHTNFNVNLDKGYFSVHKLS